MGRERIIHPLPVRPIVEEEVPIEPELLGSPENLDNNPISQSQELPRSNEPWKTKPDATGRYRVYPCRPTYIPDAVNPHRPHDLPQSDPPFADPDSSDSSSDSSSESDESEAPDTPRLSKKPDPNSRRSAKRRKRALKAALGPIPNLTTLLYARARWLSGHTELRMLCGYTSGYWVPEIFSKP
ncbi:hypothetical protein SISSUDRAFT_1067712 [Sistotremastrum suecicum HHB10207 ss-3]|uniref:Uncharacterized protein n=1 Tax=Sistotremastrum suecicum HHB10207 ss-3 TaxID=1314776 RepID=A0A165WTA8_9AGAM|nr:hypothetical protein SISSUDRAFT_1067712 [Sistotremastrum suecicum HHB10207 ss-3]